jgi:cytochrome P450
MKYPQTWHRLPKEINTADQEVNISDPVTFKEAQELSYLQAVIEEALRIHPVTAFLWSALCRENVRPLLVNLSQADPWWATTRWVPHQNRKIYGQDADSWRPERWLEIEERVRAGEVEKYFFGILRNYDLFK